MFTNKPFIVAEMSSSHLGSLKRALSICFEAAVAGADAVKLQTFTPAQMVGNPDYVIPGGPWHGRRLLSLYEEAHTPREWHKTIFDYCKELGIVCFSTPFHLDDVDFLETLNCPIYKISSFEINDHELIEKCASMNKPLVISTGMASYGEIQNAVFAARNMWWDLTLLKCTSAYPAKIDDVCLFDCRTRSNWRGANVLDGQIVKWETKCIEWGLSDHTLGGEVPLVATAIGAIFIEKHLTLSRSEGGPDAAFSMEPHEFKEMVGGCRRVITILGESSRDTVKKAEESSMELRRSLWFAQALPEGTVIERQHLKSARPALGADPARLKNIIGRRVGQLVLAGDPVTDEVLYSGDPVTNAVLD